jgi:hypothetical protein
MLTPWLRTGLGIVAYALGAALVFDGPALLLALGVGTAAFALAAQPRPAPETPRYRLEHRIPGRVRVLAAISDEETGRQTLQRQAAQLTAAGATGQLVLLNVVTGRTISWQVVGPRTTDDTVG